MKGSAVADFDNTFERFLEAWRHHQDLKSSGANLGSLVDSRIQLDSLRIDLARSRR